MTKKITIDEKTLMSAFVLVQKLAKDPSDKNKVLLALENNAVKSKNKNLTDLSLMLGVVINEGK